MHSVQRREKNGSISIKPFAPYFKTNDSYQNFSHQHFIFDFFIRRAFRTRVRYDGLISGCFTSVGQAESHPQVMSTLQARHRWNFQIITIIWSHYHIDTFQPLAAFGWRNHLAFLCFHALSPWVSLDWILTGQLGLWKLRGFPSSQLNRMESSSQPTTLRWSNMSRFKLSICWKPLVKVTTHVGSDCVLDCSLARGTEFGTGTIISMLQHFFLLF